MGINVHWKNISLRNSLCSFQWRVWWEKLIDTLVNDLRFFFFFPLWPSNKASIDVAQSAMSRVTAGLLVLRSRVFQRNLHFVLVKSELFLSCAKSQGKWDTWKHTVYSVNNWIIIVQYSTRQSLITCEYYLCNSRDELNCKLIKFGTK